MFLPQTHPEVDVLLTDRRGGGGWRWVQAGQVQAGWMSGPLLALRDCVGVSDILIQLLKVQALMLRFSSCFPAEVTLEYAENHMQSFVDVLLISLLLGFCADRLLPCCRGQVANMNPRILPFFLIHL